MAITDLTNTTWEIPSGWTATASYGAFDIDGIINRGETPYNINDFSIGSMWDYGDNTSYSATNTILYYVLSGYYDFISNSIAFILEITGGDDVTNPSLISWLEANGTCTSGGTPDPTATFDLTQLDLETGTYEITVIAMGDGYADSDPSNAVNYTVEPNTMTIDGTTYEFESGMTWSEWVASSYNTDGYKVVNGVVTTADGTKEVWEDVIGTIYDEYGIEDNGLIYTLKAAKFSFTIGGKTYTATYGMSWGEWCESAYNTDSYFVTDEYELEYIENAEGTHRVEDPYAGAVTADDVVVGEDYILVEKMQTLATPEIEIDGTTLNIYDEEGLATEYDILVDGVVKDSVEVSKDATVTITSASNSEWKNRIYLSDNAEFNTTNDAEIAQIGIGESVTLTVPVGKYIKCHYMGYSSGVVMPYCDNVSYSGDIECVRSSGLATYLINGDGSITYRAYDAD